jgi:hypothetical protein
MDARAFDFSDEVAPAVESCVVYKIGPISFTFYPEGAVVVDKEGVKLILHMTPEETHQARKDLRELIK